MAAAAAAAAAPSSAGAGGGSWEQLRPRVLSALRDVFGFEQFRGVQEAAVRAALEGRDCLVLMPTGGGKSLCYSLPAVVRGGLVLVVSPLIALMQDQLAGLQARGVSADYLSSSRTAQERQAAMARLSGAGGGAPALLFVTPELLATDGFRRTLASLHRGGRLQMLAVDESHCISQWGHDFRPTYRQLAAVRALLPGVPCMALTATATPQVKADILAQLRLRDPLLLSTSFNRPNIHYSVVLLDVQPPAARGGNPGGNPGGWDEEEVGGGVEDADHGGYGHLLAVLKPEQHQQQQQHQQHQQRAWQGPVAIVYALKRATVDALARRLAAAGLAAAGYHAALRDAEREGVLRRWRAGELQVCVATVAFGMGVDFAGTELVVHYNLPRSLEGFYQEAGRAGRAGQPSASVLMYSARDRRRLDYILQKADEDKAARKRKKQQQQQQQQQEVAAGSAAGAAQGPAAAVAAAAALRAFGEVVDLCMQPGCRRARLLRHFGEELDPRQQEQQQQQHQGQGQGQGQQRSRCCDYCDRPAVVEDLMRQQRQLEAERLQSRGRGVGGGWGAAAKRGRRGGRPGAPGTDSSGESGEHSSGEGSEDGDETAGEAAAAVADAAAAGRAEARGRPGTSGHEAFLSAMLKAEQQHERRQQQQQQQQAPGSGGGDPLQRLLAAREAAGGAKAAGGRPGALSDAVRASRRAKLAEVIGANGALHGCTPEAASQVAAALEAAAAAAPGATAAQHRAALVQLAAGAKAARGWLELPELERIGGSDSALAVVLRLGVQELLAARQQPRPTPQEEGRCSGGPPDPEAALLRLAALPVNALVLEQTGVARHVKALRKDADGRVAAAAAGAIAAWRAAVSS